MKRIFNYDASFFYSSEEKGKKQKEKEEEKEEEKEKDKQTEREQIEDRKKNLRKR